MRKLIFGINITIDGCCDHTQGISNDEVHSYFSHLTREAGTLLYGRKTYELMVPFWPEIAKNPDQTNKAYNEFAEAFVSVPQIVVVSKSLKKVDGGKTMIIHGDLQNEVAKLKSQSGKAILTGGVMIPSELLELGLIDEIHLVVHPIVAGRGRRLLDSIDLENKFQFKLAESRVFNGGHVALRYLKH